MAAGLAYDDVIDPRDLRNALLAGLDLLAARRVEVGERSPSPITTR
jgi:hypothetical protein